MSKYDNYVIYARKSVKEDGKAPGIKTQVKRINEFLSDTKIEELQGITEHKRYKDDGFSGGNWKRPAWNKMINETVLNKFGIVVVWSKDRIARDVEQFLHFFKKMSESKVRIYSVNENQFITMENAEERFTETSMAAISEFQRIQTSDKVKKTYNIKKDTAVRKGNKVEWGRVSYIDLIGVDKIIKDIKEVSDLMPGVGCRRISGILSEYKYTNKEGKVKKVKLSPSTIYRIIKKHGL